MIHVMVCHPIKVPSVVLQLGNNTLVFGYTVYMDVYLSLPLGGKYGMGCPQRLKIEYEFETDIHTSVAQILTRCEYIRASYQFLAEWNPWLFAYDYRYVDIQE